jgi:hypothetical protein
MSSDMTVEDVEVVDFVHIDHQTNVVVLTISDHLSWGQLETDEHILLLQRKIYRYLDTIRSADFRTSNPKFTGKKFVINIANKFPLSARADQFLKFVTEAASAENVDVVLGAYIKSRPTKTI